MRRTDSEKTPGRSGALAGMRQAIVSSSDRLVRIERPVMGVLIAGIFCVVLLNLISRSLGWAFYWADELAIYLMIWAAMVGASISVKLRTGISVRLMHDYLPPGGRHLVDTVVDALVLLSALCLLAFSWIWYDPLTLISSGFDTAVFKSTTFNFIYHEPTVTLQIQKFWLWLIMPLVALSMTLHSCSNLAQSFAGQELKVTR
jgi:TRAP-type C4-dicarboxylate transport system permease small subunit